MSDVEIVLSPLELRRLLQKFNWPGVASVQCATVVLGGRHMGLGILMHEPRPTPTCQTTPATQ